jgi:plasmid stabilization system protein ParE
MFLAKIPTWIWRTFASASLKISVDAADGWITKLFDAIEAIGRSPGIGHKREDLTYRPVLFFSLGAYLIVDRAIRQPV